MTPIEKTRRRAGAGGSGVGSVVAGLLAATAVLLAAACYSDRTTAPRSAAGACQATLDPGQFGSSVIAIQDFAFKPNTIRVAAGGKVTWVNCEPAGTPAHTTTADAGQWASSLLDPGASFSFTFPTAGTFSYHCSTHPFMTGEIVVQ
jgi:plastocyanin